MNLLTMNRQGEFSIRTFGPIHCGVAENLTIKYHMICECESRLDSRGFLFDQINVDNYFKRMKRSKLSCEKMTVKCVRDLVKLIRTENPTCVVRKINLTLSPQPFMASMTYTWENDKAR